jgi:hypothetical protein
MSTASANQGNATQASMTDPIKFNLKLTDDYSFALSSQTYRPTLVAAIAQAQHFF